MLLKRLRELGGETLIYGVPAIVARFLSVWLTPIYTRLLTPEDYGIMSLVGATIVLIQSFATLALDQAAIRWFIDADDSDGQRRPFATWAWMHFATATAATVVLMLAGDRISVLLTGSSKLAPWLRLASITIPLGVATSVGLTWLRMQRRAWATVALVTGTSVLQLAATFVLVVSMKRGLFGLYLAQVITAAIAMLVVLRIDASAMAPRLFNRAMLGAMLRYSAPLVPAAIAVWLVGSIDRFFVERFVSTTEVGVFAIGSSIASLLTLAIWAFQQAWAPFALSICREPDAEKTFNTVFLGYCGVGALATAGLSMFAPLAIRILATPAYDRASLVVGTLAMSYVLMGLASVVSIGFTIAKASRPTAIAVGIAAAVTVALNAALVPRFGMIGSATATLLGQSVQPAILLWRGQHIYPISYPIRRGGALLAYGLLLVLLGETWLPSALTAYGFLIRLFSLASLPVFALAIGAVSPSQRKTLRLRLLRR